MYSKEIRGAIGLISIKEDEELVTSIINILKEKELTVDRASRVLKDAQTLIPLLARLN